MQPSPGLSYDTNSELGRYEALLQMADSLVRHRSLEELFRDVSSRLHEVTAFELITFNLHDPATDSMQVYYWEGADLGQPPVRFSMEQTPSGWVWQHQELLAIPRIAAEKRFPVMTRVLDEAGISSYCCIPLTTARRKWGALGLGSQEVGSFGQRDLKFLKRVADLFAVAIEGALIYSALQEEKERLQVLLEINATLVSNLDLRESFPAISGYIRKVVDQDFASLAIYNPEARVMSEYPVDYPSAPDLFQIGQTHPMTAISGQAFVAREMKLVGQDEMRESESSVIQQLLKQGVKSICCIPLVSRKGPLGTLNLGSKAEAAFVPQDIGLLKQVASQLAAALDNSQAYAEIAGLRDKLAQEKVYLQGEIRSALNFEEIVGNSPNLLKALDSAKIVAPSDATVLILGETGTGKELIARAIHRMSERKDGGFIKLNCAAIPTGLLESELFGHEKGAFTGAISQKLGRLELADKGTLFLDEVGDIPLEVQPKLLRVLQDQEFERLGSTRTLQVNVRLVAATNRDLAKRMAENEFRSDLYYRLSVFPIHVPALRDRREDIPLLVRFFVGNFARRMNKQIDTIPTEALNILKRWDWPGNVRELANFIERSVILSPGPVLNAPLAELMVQAGKAEDRDTLEDLEREHILRALRESGGTIAGIRGAAARLGLKRTTLQSKMLKMGITRRDYEN